MDDRLNDDLRKRVEFCTESNTSAGKCVSKWLSHAAKYKDERAKWIFNARGGNIQMFIAALITLLSLGKHKLIVFFMRTSLTKRSSIITNVPGESKNPITDLNGLRTCLFSGWLENRRQWATTTWWSRCSFSLFSDFLCQNRKLWSRVCYIHRTSLHDSSVCVIVTNSVSTKTQLCDWKVNSVSPGEPRTVSPATELQVVFVSWTLTSATAGSSLSPLIRTELQHKQVDVPMDVNQRACCTHYVRVATSKESLIR